MTVLLTSVLIACSLDYTPPKRYAIVYGVSIYQPTYPRNLAYPDLDADAMAAMFTAEGFDSVEKRISTDPLLARPSKANLITDLASIAGMAGPNDLVVVYYSGHGGQFDYQGATHEWIFPYDSVNASFNIDFSKSISDTDLADMLRVLPTKRIVVILDSCNSGGLIGGGIEVDAVPPQLYGHSTWSGIITPATIAQAISNYATFTTSDNGGASPYKALTIAGSGTNESAYESGAPYNHGILTYFLLQAPADGDLNKDGYVTALEAFALAKAGIEEQWNPHVLNSEMIFSPHISGGPIDLVLF